ncbi:MAG: hypothetical protein EOO15_13510 [Chitinophagaceae bacterium]|nr:MAG: hypothetical protein EOO15_13510 [Chitinophagaceae bacterium]
MKKIFLFLILCLGVCTGSFAQKSAGDEQLYFKQHVALTDARVRVVAKGQLVREIVLADFSKTQKIAPAFGLNNDVFLDDGKGNDLKAGDGVYTSTDIYPGTEKTAGLEEGATRSTLDKPVVDPGFSHQAELEKYFSADQSATGKVGISLTCDMVWCNCASNCRCRACDVSWLPHRCFELKNCSVTVDFTF